MKYLVIIAFLISTVLSAPAPQDNFDDQPAQSFAQSGNNVEIVRYFFDWYPDEEDGTPSGYRYT